MTVKLGFNGFGRMGRLGLRAGWQRSGDDIVKNNETATDAAGSAHLLSFDSVHGRWPVQTSAAGDVIRIEDEALAYSSGAAIGDGDWSACDIVIGAAGKHHKHPETLQAYFDQGVKRYWWRHPPKAR